MTTVLTKLLSFSTGYPFEGNIHNLEITANSTDRRKAMNIFSILIRYDKTILILIRNI